MQNKAKNPTNEYSLKIPADQLLEFWRHFQAAGNQVKQNMIATVSWVMVLVSGVLGYLVGKLQMFGDVSVDDILFMRVLTVLGFAFCIYVLWLVREFGKAMSGNWKRADQIGDELANEEGLNVSINRSREIPGICWVMYIITGSMALAFIIGFTRLMLP